MLMLITKLADAKKFARDDSGATAIEYGLIAALIAVIIIGGITAIGTDLGAMFDTIATNF